MKDNHYLIFEHIVKYLDMHPSKIIYKHTWLSGSSTTVYPISFWKNQMVIQLEDKARRNQVKKLAESIMKLNTNFFTNWVYDIGDGSCPKTLTLYYKESN